MSAQNLYATNSVALKGNVECHNLMVKLSQRRELSIVENLY